MTEGDGLMFGGRPVPNPHNDRVAAEARAADNRRAAAAAAAKIEDEKKKTTRSRDLLEELVIEFEERERKDPIMRGLERKLEDAKFRAEAARDTIKARRRFLRRLAVTTIRKRHGVKIIPGYNDRPFSFRAEVLELPAHVKRLLERLNVALPSGFQQDQPEPPKEESEQNPT